MNARPVVTFDCYRTLIDFDLNAATLPIVKDRLTSLGVDQGEFLDNLRVMRFQGVVAEPYRKYRDIIRATLQACMLLHGIPYRDADYEQLIEAAKKFPVFADVPPVLEKLRETHDIAIISNTDDDLIPYHLDTIGVEFDYVVTAEQAKVYKPHRAAFDHLFSVLDRPLDLVTHAAQGWEYDILPTKRYGIKRVWVNRYHKAGNDYYQPYEEISDLSRLLEVLSI